jgi:hypothetical protein
MSTERWRDRMRVVWFPKYPRSVTNGSRLVYYAAGAQRLCAVAEVIADEPSQTGHERWPYELPVRMLVAIPADHNAPSLADVGFDPLRVRRQSHVRLNDREYAAMTKAIAAAVRTATRLSVSARQLA